FDLPYACVRAVNPGEMLPLVDRVVRVVRSSIFDSPGTTGFLDTTIGTLFSSDCFGELTPFRARDGAEYSDAELRDVVYTGSWLILQWLALVDRDRFAARLDGIRRIDPALFHSADLPPARAMQERLLAGAELVPNRPAQPTTVGSRSPDVDYR
ncbi:MAG: hypothetical protein ACRDWA_17275, partial [Acidimicrobiia bacterium]